MVKSQKNLIHRLRQKFKSVDFGCKNRALLPLFGQHKHFFLKKEATIQRSLNLNAKNEKKSNEPILRKKGITGGLTDRTDRRPDRTDIQTNGRTAE